MRTRKYLQIGLLSFLAFGLLCSPAQFYSLGAHRALAASEVVPSEPEEPVGELKVADPYEGFNRSMFTLNDRLYFYVLKPVSIIYAAYFPPGVREAVRNGFYNLVFPARFVNCVLQGKGDKAGTETARFLINSTMGVGGLFDVAERNFGISTHEEDFGQTLGVWGAGSGSFLMLPVLGPSNPRDFLGYLVDSTMDPIFWIPSEIWVGPAVKIGKIVNNGSLRIGEYEDFKKGALDPYVSMRDAYIQYRQNQIRK